MKTPRLVALLVCSVALVTLGCASPVEIKANLDPNDYATCPSGGTVRVTGATFARQKNGNVVSGAGRWVHLDPATRYSAAVYRAVAEKQKDGGFFTAEKESETVAPNTVMFKCRRNAQADAEGKFTFENVPPGLYILSTYLSWMKPHGDWVGVWSFRKLPVNDRAKTTEIVLTGSPITISDP